MTNRIFGNQNNYENNTPPNNMPPFEDYQDFADKMKAHTHAQLVHGIFFWSGVISSWIVFCVISAIAIRYLLPTLSFFPKTIEVSILDILKIYVVFIFLWGVRKLFPLS